MPKSKAITKVPMPGAVATEGGFALDLIQLEEVCRSKPLPEVARYHVDVRPVLKQAEELIDKIVRKRMESEDQEVVPIMDPETGEIDGRNLVLRQEHGWEIDADQVKAAQEEFQKQKYGKHPDVVALYREERSVVLDIEAMRILGIDENDLLKLGDRYKVTRYVAGRSICKKALKLGGLGKVTLEAAMTQTDGAKRLKIEGEKLRTDEPTFDAKDQS